MGFDTDLTTWSPSKVQALSKTSSLVQALQAQSLRNREGEPLCYVDPQCIMANYSHLDPQETTLHDVPDAITPLYYQDGYPTTPDGVPFWERLDNEPVPYYEYFKSFRDDTYIKSLQTDNGNNTKVGSFVSKSVGARLLTRVANRVCVDRQILKTVSELYHWRLRAEAYDTFNKGELEKLRSAEVQYMQNKHMAAAEYIFDKSLKWLEQNHEELNPNSALQWFQTAVELHRLSLGLPKDKPEQGEGEAHVDRRPWVQINQQYNQSGNGTTPQGNLTSGDGASSGTSEDRMQTILRTLNEAGVLDVSQLGNQNKEQGQDQDDSRDVIDVD